MNLDVWIAYFLTELVLSLTPGPAVLLVSSQGLKYGARTSYVGALGISSANLVYFVLSALGLGVLIMEADTLFNIIKLVGACYLIFIGLKMFVLSFRKNEIAVAVSSEENMIANKNAFFQAFVTQISNPKAIIFFVSLLPQFISSKENLTLQITILALTTVIMETAILFFYGWLSARGRDSLKNSKSFSDWVDRLAGGVLIGIGIHLLYLKTKAGL